MTTLNLPATVTLSAATDTPVQFNWNGAKEVQIVNLTSTVAYARGDGPAAVIAADYNYACPQSPFVAEVPIQGASDGTATVHLISSGTPTLHLYFEDDDD